MRKAQKDTEANENLTETAMDEEECNNNDKNLLIKQSPAPSKPEEATESDKKPRLSAPADNSPVEARQESDKTKMMQNCIVASAPMPHSQKQQRPSSKSPVRLTAMQHGHQKRNNHVKTDPSDPHNLDARFVSNQLLLFDDALAELQSGAKRSCWLWFVLPTAPHIVNGQERGSNTNQYFALRGDDAVVAYLKFERKGVNLRQNYIAIIKTTQAQLEQGNTMLRLFGPMDLNKAVSSFQLFRRIAHDMKDSELEMLCQNVLNLVALDKQKREARNNDEDRRKEYRHTMTV